MLSSQASVADPNCCASSKAIISALQAKAVPRNLGWEKKYK
jgi:hypothetical protein